MSTDPPRPVTILANLGYEMDAVPPMGNYVPVSTAGPIAWVSGHPPARDGAVVYQGKVGKDLSVEEGQEAARLCVANCLAALRQELNGLERVERILRVLAWVNCADDFASQPLVVDAASDLLTQVLGRAGQHARAAVGTNALPANIAVEIEMMAAIRE